MKKDWRWRLYKLLVYIDVDCGEQELGFAIGIEGVEKLEKLVERELDKAREEGFREGIELEQLLNAEFFEEDYQNPKRLRELKKKYNFKEDK
jgi:hypothetical protein